MQRLFHLIIISLFIFVTNAGATVLMDEVAPGESLQSTTQHNDGIRNALETTSGSMTNAVLTMPMKGYVLAANTLDPQAIIQETLVKPEQETDTFLLLIAVIGLIIFIVRRRSGN